MPELKPCPRCGFIPLLGYCCGEYFIAGNDIVPKCKACGPDGFGVMHSDPRQTIEEWNNWCESFERKQEVECGGEFL